MTHFSRSLADRVAARHRPPRTEMLTDGVSANSIRTMVTAGVLVTCHQSVNRVATSPETFESRCAAACFADSSAVISGPAAAQLWNFRNVHRLDGPIVAVTTIVTRSRMESSCDEPTC